MKKITVLFSVLLMTLALVACGASVNNARATVSSSKGGTRQMSFTIKVTDPDKEVTAPKVVTSMIKLNWKKVCLIQKNSPLQN